ncbi:ras and Rab interactor 1-like isoform X1 [Xyrichtys novacula]|uniref:Ras and Rab interactor 1-like isoform X1 n=1 Tax=Xyrichtys novacula TaxID=13765 RepID=A0AAV1FQ44_XYRNO|nr:ras and Rab interactor 1-like isoform X1 [Xyrichtys novacula]
MAQQGEPLYDFPEPTKSSKGKFLGHQRSRGSLRSISVLDRLLLTVPVWLQLSINPATALHILQREPPGTFLVRKSRTSQRNVLCVRLADDSVPSFVQQFGIREERASQTLSLETSAISFPDLPRLISFYCVSRDVLPFPLELPEAIAKASSHKELESISHMGVEFWNSHLNVRGPREALKPQTDQEKKPDPVAPVLPTSAAPQTSSAPATLPDAAPQPNSDPQTKTAPEADADPPGPGSTLFQEFCPITTRSPRELDCGSGLGALCFINPLFLQSLNALSRKRMFKRSLKVRISTETSSLLSPPLAPPPPPPLMPKTRGRCKARKQGTHPGKGPNQTAQSDPVVQGNSGEGQVKPPTTTPHFHPEIQEQEEVTAQLLPTVMEHLSENSDYMQPSPVITSSNTPSLSPYLSPPGPPLFPKQSPSISPHGSPGASPSLSPYQSPSLSPRALSPNQSPSDSPSASPPPSPKAPFSLSPFTSPEFAQLEEQAYHTPRAWAEREAEEEGRGESESEETDEEDEEEEEEEGLVLQMSAAALNDKNSCRSSSSPEGAAERQPHDQGDGTSL